MARERIAEMEDAELVVVNASGCSAHVKTYGELLADDPVWAERAERVAERTVDLIELSPPPRDAGHRDGGGARRVPPPPRPGPGAAGAAARRGRDVRRAGRRRALLRRGRPLQRPPARAGGAAAAAEGGGDRRHRRPRGRGRQPGVRHPDRRGPAGDRRARCGWRTRPSWSPRSAACERRPGRWPSRRASRRGRRRHRGRGRRGRAGRQRHPGELHLRRRGLGRRARRPRHVRLRARARDHPHAPDREGAQHQPLARPRRRGQGDAQRRWRAPDPLPEHL